MAAREPSGEPLIGLMTKGHEETFGDNGDGFVIVVLISRVITCAQTHQIIHFKYVQLIIPQYIYL